MVGKLVRLVAPLQLPGMFTSELVPGKRERTGLVYRLLDSDRHSA